MVEFQPLFLITVALVVLASAANPPPGDTPSELQDYGYAEGVSAGINPEMLVDPSSSITDFDPEVANPKAGNGTSAELDPNAPLALTDSKQNPKSKPENNDTKVVENSTSPAAAPGPSGFSDHELSGLEAAMAPDLYSVLQDIYAGGDLTNSTAGKAPKPLGSSASAAEVSAMAAATVVALVGYLAF